MLLKFVLVQGVNIMAFCKEYNAKTADKIGQIIPVAITVYDVSACRLHVSDVYSHAYTRPGGRTHRTRAFLWS